MEFDWTEEQRRIKDGVVSFAMRELAPLRTGEHSEQFSREVWKKCADFGLLGLPLPQEYGGSEVDLLSTMLAMEGLGYGCRDLGLAFALNAQIWAVQLPILKFGSKEQRARFLPGLCSGQLIGAHGMTEPNAGSDAYSLRTRATKRDGGYVLNGSKTFVTNAPVADIALVFATTDPELGRWGITCFIVEREQAGFTAGRNMEKMGLRSAPMGELVLNDCFVPEGSRLGPEGGGVSVFSSSMNLERSCILASHVGAMERLLEACVEHARTRSQFGQPIGKFQSVSNRIADMKVRLETARLVLYRAAWLNATGQDAEIAAAIAKLYVSECFVRSSEDAIRVHGGYGYVTESGIEQGLRDALGGILYSGTSDIQRLIIARWLGV